LSVDPRERLILALDLSSVREAEAMIATLGDTVGFYKIGYHLAFAGGLELAGALVRAGKRVFVDLKLHDIGSTVARGVESIARIGATFLTVHGYPQTMQAAVAARSGSSLRLLAVTVLTSYRDAELVQAGYPSGLEQLVALRAAQAQAIGVDGLVCSPLDAATLRTRVGPRMLLVTPGVRPAGTAAGDQRRVATPASAVAAGADYLVVGRPILGAADPKSAVLAIIDEMARAVSV
jgi:orotidine-5'-phosphate decarboxylase